VEVRYLRLFGGRVIVSPRGDRLLMVRQVDHQTHCGLMARAFGDGEFARIEHWDSVVTAADLHDEGWRECDDAPGVNGEGTPVDFPDLDRSEHVALYGRGIDLIEARDPRAGLVVSMHGQGLHEARLGLDGTPRDRSRQQPAVRAFIEREEARQARLLEEIGDPGCKEWAWAAYRLLQAWDLLSLYLLWYGLPNLTTGQLDQVPRRVGDAGIDIAAEPVDERFALLRPFPFPGDEAVFPVAARYIPNRRYETNDDLRAALDAAPWTTLEVGVRRLKPESDPGTR
jgi:hypothetical protein